MIMSWAEEEEENTEEIRGARGGGGPLPLLRSKKEAAGVRF